MLSTFSRKFCSRVRNFSSVQPLKLIFLDVDGVLNNYRCTEPSEETGGGEIVRFENALFRLFTNNCKPFVQLIQQTEAKVIVASSWRNYQSGMELLNKFFVQNSIECLGTTTDLGEAQLAQQRCKEIYQWLEDNMRGKSDFDWIAIDDDPNNHMTQISQQLVKTESNIGMTEEDRIQALKLLKVNDNSKKV